MLGAIVGDVIGSPFEFDFNREEAHSKQFPLVSRRSYATDDSVLTLAVAEGIMNAIPVRGQAVSEEALDRSIAASFRRLGNEYPDAGYGGRFKYWLLHNESQPYNSYGNGSAMRVSPVAWAFDTLDDVEKFAAVSARITHNHPEGIKGAQATAGAIFLARTGKSKQEIRDYVVNRYGYDLSRTLDEIRPNYYHVESCQETVPEAITAFLEGKDFEDVARCAVSLSGDSDTLTAISCSIAEGYYGIPDEITDLVMPKLVRLGQDLADLLNKWEQWRA
ncbi:MAG: ADP-ribosylglycohydrolase family protein [Synergistaceae bacterium]|nr:ADP-ribosylglycohydrolase family protein [Synergistaceae bacterium]